MEDEHIITFSFKGVIRFILDWLVVFAVIFFGFASPTVLPRAHITIDIMTRMTKTVPIPRAVSMRAVFTISPKLI